MTTVRYVQRVRKGGNVHLYFRKGDHREGPLRSPDGSKELQAEVDGILARLATVAAAQTPMPGTVGAMLRIYNKSADTFLTRARSTQAEYQRLIDELIADCGDVPLSDVTPAWLRDMRGAWAVRGYKAANDRRQVLKNALEPAVADDRVAGDPFAKVKRLKAPHGRGEARLAWEDHEVDAAIAEAIRRGRHGLARAIGLGRWGGFRRGTICAIPLSARRVGYDDEGARHQRLNWVTEKRRVLCDKREDPRLTELFGRTNNATNSVTIAYNADGYAWKPRQLNQALDRLMASLAKAGKVRATTSDDGAVYCPLTLHGLRHARGVELAEAGASDAEIMSQLEHASDRQAKDYRRQASRRRMADQGQERIDNVVKLRERRKAKETVK
jgi:integrase